VNHTIEYTTYYDKLWNIKRVFNKKT